MDIKGILFLPDGHTRHNEDSHGWMDGNTWMDTTLERAEEEQGEEDENEKLEEREEEEEEDADHGSSFLKVYKWFSDHTKKMKMTTVRDYYYHEF